MCKFPMYHTTHISVRLSSMRRYVFGSGYLHEIIILHKLIVLNYLG